MQPENQVNTESKKNKAVIITAITLGLVVIGIYIMAIVLNLPSH